MKRVIEFTYSSGDLFANPVGWKSSFAGVCMGILKQYFDVPISATEFDLVFKSIKTPESYEIAFSGSHVALTLSDKCVNREYITNGSRKEFIAILSQFHNKVYVSLRA